MPMLSLDFMYIVKKRKAYLEVYDLVEDSREEKYSEALGKLKQVFDGFSDLEDFDPTPAWYDVLFTVRAYKACESDKEERFAELIRQCAAAYAEGAAEMELLPEEEKKTKYDITNQYVDDLIEKGGLPTRTFKKALGEDGIREFFHGDFFGTER